LLLKQFVIDALALPLGIVCILDLELWKRIVFAFAKCAVDGAQIAKENAH